MKEPSGSFFLPAKEKPENSVCPELPEEKAAADISAFFCSAASAPEFPGAGAIGHFFSGNTIFV